MRLKVTIEVGLKPPGIQTETHHVTASTKAVGKRMALRESKKWSPTGTKFRVTKVGEVIYNE